MSNQLFAQLVCWAKHKTVAVVMFGILLPTVWLSRAAQLIHKPQRIQVQSKQEAPSKHALSNYLLPIPLPEIRQLIADYLTHEWVGQKAYKAPFITQCSLLNEWNLLVAGDAMYQWDIASGRYQAFEQADVFSTPFESILELEHSVVGIRSVTSDVVIWDKKTHKELQKYRLSDMPFPATRQLVPLKSTSWGNHCFLQINPHICISQDVFQTPAHEKFVIVVCMVRKQESGISSKYLSDGTVAIHIDEQETYIWDLKNSLCAVSHTKVILLHLCPMVCRQQLCHGSCKLQITKVMCSTSAQLRGMLLNSLCS